MLAADNGLTGWSGKVLNAVYCVSVDLNPGFSNDEMQSAYRSPVKISANELF